MFIYRPHVHQLDGTITPDLIVDAAYLVGTSECVQLLDHVQVGEYPQAPVAALVIVAARYGTLLAPGCVLRSEQGGGAVCYVSRQAWRLPDVRDHLDALALHVVCRDSAGLGSMVDCRLQARLIDPAPGTARCEVAKHSPFSASAVSIELTLNDPILNRTLAHCIFLPVSQASPV